MKKIALSAFAGALLAILAVAGPARGQTSASATATATAPVPPPPPPGPGQICPPPGCTPTPTVTPVPTATSTPTATGTAIPLFLHVQLLHKVVKAGKTQRITVNTLPAAQVKIVLVFLNKSKKSHSGVAPATGSLRWTYSEPHNKSTKHNRVVKITITAHNGVDPDKKNYQHYRIG